MKTQRLVFGLGVVVIALTAVAVPVQGLSDEEARLFFSDDEEENIDDVSGNITDPANYARVTDIVYPTTLSQYEVDSTTLASYRGGQLRAMETNNNRSYALPDSTVTDSGVIRDAHITYTGVVGGAHPRLNGSYRTFVGDDGFVLNHVDYRIVVPEDYCDTDYDVDVTDWNGDGDLEQVINDGTRECYSYSVSTNVDRWATIDGTRYDGNESIRYRDLDAETATIELNAQISVTVNERVDIDDWESGEQYPSNIDDGVWLDEDIENNIDNQSSLRVSDTEQVRVTDNGELDVSQTIVEDGSTTYSVITFDGPSELEQRVLWSYIQYGDSDFVQGPWGVYSIREHDHGYRYNATNETRVDPSGHPLRQYLIGNNDRPTARGVDGSTDMLVEGYGGQRYSDSGSLHDNVDVTITQPTMYDYIIVRNPPQPADSLTTVHGNSIELDVDNRAQFRRPEIAIEQVSDSDVRVHVEDPETGAPISGQTVTLIGAETSSATTNGNGNVTVTRTSPVVRATVPSDDWANPTGNVIYGRASVSKAILSGNAVFARLVVLFRALVLVSPLILLYFYIRTFGFFE